MGKWSIRLNMTIRANLFLTDNYHSCQQPEIHLAFRKKKSQLVYFGLLVAMVSANYGNK